jgi:hypothetical protein
VAVDPLADWWRHTLDLWRFVKDAPYGRVYSPPLAEGPANVTGYYRDETILNAAGQIEASGRFAFPRAVAYVPVKSRMRLPAAFGGRTVDVVKVQVGDGGGQPTPDHQIVWVL